MNTPHIDHINPEPHEAGCPCFQCWAYSTIRRLEGELAKAQGKLDLALEDLSEHECQAGVARANYRALEREIAALPLEAAERYRWLRDSCDDWLQFQGFAENPGESAVFDAFLDEARGISLPSQDTGFKGGECPHSVLTSSPTTANRCAACGKFMPSPWPMEGSGQ